MVDLPGITRVPIADQPKNIEAQIMQLILKCATVLCFGLFRFARDGNSERKCAHSPTPKPVTHLARHVGLPA